MWFGHLLLVVSKMGCYYYLMMMLVFENFVEMVLNLDNYYLLDRNCLWGMSCWLDMNSSKVLVSEFVKVA